MARLKNFSVVGKVDETIKVLQAYEVYKMHHGYRWSGINQERWVKG